RRGSAACGTPAFPVSAPVLLLNSLAYVPLPTKPPSCHPPAVPGAVTGRPIVVQGGAPVTDNWVMIEGIAVWRDELTPAERAQLGREPGVIPEPRPDVLVVGGGIVGVATAAACHEAGLGSVLVIEAGRLCAGATGGAAGLLTPEIHEWSDPEPFVDLARASLELWGELEQTWPGGVGLIELDWIGLAPDP